MGDGCRFQPLIFQGVTVGPPKKKVGSFGEDFVGSSSNISESQGTKHPARVVSPLEKKQAGVKPLSCKLWPQIGGGWIFCESSPLNTTKT